MLNKLNKILTKTELKKVLYLYNQYYYASYKSKVAEGRSRKKYFKYLNKLFNKYQKILANT